MRPRPARSENSAIHSEFKGLREQEAGVKVADLVQRRFGRSVGPSQSPPIAAPSGAVLPAVSDSVPKLLEKLRGHGMVVMVDVTGRLEKGTRRGQRELRLLSQELCQNIA
ncbi:MAG: hypothetical protein JWL84_5830 [Rhodospirillales bacterium]|jgi:hypothetical protein|nr:hypothetical protein [Rhodospirillales bacterium]